MSLTRCTLFIPLQSAIRSGGDQNFRKGGGIGTGRIYYFKYEILGTIGKDRETQEMSLGQAGGRALGAERTDCTSPEAHVLRCAELQLTQRKNEMGPWDLKATGKPLL